LQKLLSTLHWPNCSIIENRAVRSVLLYCYYQRAPFAGYAPNKLIDYDTNAPAMSVINVAESKARARAVEE